MCLQAGSHCWVQTISDDVTCSCDGRLQSFCSVAQVFNYIITAVIVINIAILASTVYDESTAFTNAKEDCNYAFTAFFILEATIKITGLGWRSYWRNGWNKFDFFLILMAMVDIGFTAIASHGSQVGQLCVHACQDTSCLSKLPVNLT